jgi:hypothetical protein
MGRGDNNTGLVGELSSEYLGIRRVTHSSYTVHANNLMFLVIDR